VIARIAAALLLLAVTLPVSGHASDLRGRIEAQRRKIQQTYEQLKHKKAQLQEATVHVGDLRSQLDQTSAAIGRVNSQLEYLAAEQYGMQRKLAWNTVQLRAAQSSLKLHDDLLKRRLVDVYEHGEGGYLAVLLASQSFSDFVERWQDLRLLIQANQREVRERKAAERKVAYAQAALQAVQEQLDEESNAQMRARSQLDALAGERRNLVAIAESQRRHVASQYAQMEALSGAQEAELEREIQQYEAEQAALARARGIVGTQTAPGILSWPVTGPITSGFGYRQNPFGGGMEFHQGLDIAAPMGTTVTAAASGTVISAGWYGGYGNFILIDDGGGMATGYAHLSQMFVGAGQKVQKGQAIGAVGSTGMSTGPHLHFEVRIGGKPVDPAAYLH
jgi:murein DD-endopeptidase MepM/ murein hydrolase activator NlpD